MIRTLKMTAPATALVDVPNGEISEKSEYMSIMMPMAADI
jgi:hypothetical protein